MATAIGVVPCRSAYTRELGCSTRSARTAELRPRAFKQPTRPAEPALEPYNLEPRVSLNLWQRYCLSLETNPTQTKAVTSLVGFLAGDCLAQFLEAGASFDAARLVRLSAYGFLLDGPVGHMWYRWLDGTVDKTFSKNPKGAMAVGIKTAADQLIWAPVMTVVFFAFLKLLEGQPDMVWATVAEKTLPTVAANYVIWPAAHIISFRYVPSQQRILYNNTVAIFWNCYLSLVAANNGTDASSSPSWSWDAYAFWVGLPGGVDPGTSRSITEMCVQVQSALGIHSPEPVATAAVSGFTKFYQQILSAVGMHSPQPAPVQAAAHCLVPLPGVSTPPAPVAPPAAAHGTEGLALQLQGVTESAAKTQEVVQGGMHEGLLMANFWLQHYLPGVTQSVAHSHEALVAIFNSVQKAIH